MNCSEQETPREPGQHRVGPGWQRRWLCCHVQQMLPVQLPHDQQCHLLTRCGQQTLLAQLPYDQQCHPRIPFERNLEGKAPQTSISLLGHRRRPAE